VLLLSSTPSPSPLLTLSYTYTRTVHCFRLAHLVDSGFLTQGPPEDAFERAQAPTMPLLPCRRQIAVRRAWRQSQGCSAARQKVTRPQRPCNRGGLCAQTARAKRNWVQHEGSRSENGLYSTIFSTATGMVGVAGVEWEMDIDWSGTNVVVASEAHAITLAVEGLLGVIFTVSLLTDEAFEDAFAVRGTPLHLLSRCTPSRECLCGEAHSPHLRSSYAPPRSLVEASSAPLLISAGGLFRCVRKPTTGGSALWGQRKRGPGWRGAGGSREDGEEEDEDAWLLSLPPQPRPRGALPAHGRERVEAHFGRAGRHAVALLQWGGRHPRDPQGLPGLHAGQGGTKAPPTSAVTWALT